MIGPKRGPARSEHTSRQPSYNVHSATDAQPVPQPLVVTEPSEPGSGQATASLVLGITSILFSANAVMAGLDMFWIYGYLALPCLGFLGFATGVVCLVLGIMGRKSITWCGSATAGIVLSSISVVLATLSYILWFALIKNWLVKNWLENPLSSLASWG